MVRRKEYDLGTKKFIASEILTYVKMQIQRKASEERNDSERE